MTTLSPNRDASAFTSSSSASMNNDPNASPVRDRSIGDIIAETRNLSAEQVEQVLSYQRKNGIRFGEAAVALGYASTDDVLFALAQQFHYPYASEAQNEVSTELVSLKQPFSEKAEAIRAIRSQVMMRVFGETAEGNVVGRAVAIVSPQSGEGKSFLAANLAVTLAQLGGRTLLVDADLRGPRLHEIFNLPNTAGLSGILSGREQTQVVQKITGVPSLFVMPAGPTPPNPLELVERPAFGLLMRELSSKFDHVVIDTPAAEYGADGLVIASRCGAALLVARKNSSQVAPMQDLVLALSESPAKLIGVIFNEF